MLTQNSRDPRPTTPGENKKDKETTEEPDVPQLKPVSRVNTGNRITFAKDANEPPTSPRALYIPSPRDRDRGKSIPILAAKSWSDIQQDNPSLKRKRTQLKKVRPCISPFSKLLPTCRPRRRRDQTSPISRGRRGERHGQEAPVQARQRQPVHGQVCRESSHVHVCSWFHCPDPRKAAHLSFHIKSSVGRSAISLQGGHRWPKLSVQQPDSRGPGASGRYRVSCTKATSQGCLWYAHLPCQHPRHTCSRSPGYFFGLHILGTICLVPWIHNAPKKYTDYLAECGLNESWW